MSDRYRLEAIDDACDRTRGAFALIEALRADSVRTADVLPDADRFPSKTSRQGW